MLLYQNKIFIAIDSIDKTQLWFNIRDTPNIPFVEDRNVQGCIRGMFSETMQRYADH